MSLITRRSPCAPQAIDLYYGPHYVKTVYLVSRLTEQEQEREMGRMPIDKPYAYHKPSDDGLDKINRLREHFSEGEKLIREVCPESRQKSIAITNNEQTAMWAIKAVVFNDPKSEFAP